MDWYNDISAQSCDWLLRLMADGKLPHGLVDYRSVVDVDPDDVRHFDRCHFFAGIGGWPLALELAGWPRDRRVWTASLPCQPFSTAAPNAKGFDDERHLWPVFRDLVDECRPPVCFGEQVGSPRGLEWLAGVRSDLEDCGYAVAAVDLPAASVGAPHIRQRLFWVAHANGKLRGADVDEQKHSPDRGRHAAGRGEARSVCHTNSVHIARVLEACGDASSRRSDDQAVRAPDTSGFIAHSTSRSGGADGSFWEPYDIGFFRDGKARRIEPGTEPLVDGLPQRVERVEGYGNAIVPQVGAMFVRAYMDVAG